MGGVEHYADYGHSTITSCSAHSTGRCLRCPDYKSEPLSVEFGIVRGFTAGSDALIRWHDYRVEGLNQKR